MGTTSFGSVTTGIVISFLGAMLLVAGGFAFAQYGIAEAEHEERSHGPFGLFGHSERSEAGVEAFGVGGFALGLVGLAFLLYGLLVIARAFEAGKDREVQTGRL